MLKRNLVLVCFLTVGAFLMTTPVLAQQVRGVLETEIVIGQTGPQSGPAALWGAVARGSGLFFKGLNDEGGIHGIKIKYILRDDGYQPAKTRAIATEFVEQDKIFGVVGCVGVGPGMAVRDYYTENKVVMVSFGCSGVTNWIQPFNRYIFPVYQLYVDEAKALTRYFYENMKLTKVAVFYQNDDYGKQGLEGVERFEKEKGLKVVAAVSAEVTDRDLSSHALKLKNSGAEAVVMWAMPTHAALLLAECAKIGYKPQWGTSSTLSDTPVLMQITKGLWAGMVVSYPIEAPNSNHPLMVKYRAWHQKYEPNERWGSFYYSGCLYAEPLAEGLRRAGRNLTPETFIKAMETLRDWPGGIGAPITFTPTNHQGTRDTYFAQVQPDGSLKKLTDWIRITK